jgi:hypothetical protein
MRRLTRRGNGPDRAASSPVRMRLGGARFVAGESLDRAVPVLRRLTDQGLLTNTTILGEHLDEAAAIERVVGDYEELLRRLAAEGCPRTWRSSSASWPRSSERRSRSPTSSVS